MPKKKAEQNGHDRLDQAIALLIQNEAAFVARLNEADKERAEMRREQIEIQRATEERFRSIEGQMAEIIRVLNEHTRVLERLPEAVRDKIGFKGQP
jgi:hypothetical protein